MCFDFAWNNQNLALPNENLEARALTITLCLYFLACSPCSSLADSFTTTTLLCLPPISTAGIACLIIICQFAPLVSTRWNSTLACIITTCLSLCSSFVHPLELHGALRPLTQPRELCSSVHHKNISVTVRHLCPPAGALQ